jgi:uncharacterized protein YlaI
MKEVLLKFINNYDNKIIIDIDNVNYISYENHEHIYIDLGKQDLNSFLSMLKQDFKIQETISNLEDGFLVYEFYIPNDMAIGEGDCGNGEIVEIFTVETSVYLTTRNYKTVYHSYLNSKDWYNKRNICLEYANYKCSICDETENLHVHHLNYNTVGNESISDLIVVCKSCHSDFHKKTR